MERVGCFCPRFLFFFFSFPRFYFSLFIVSRKFNKKVEKITFIRFRGNFLLHVFLIYFFTLNLKKEAFLHSL